MISGDAHVTRSPSAAWREIDGQVAIVSVDVNRVRLLNATGGFIWKKCDRASVADLVRDVCVEFAVSEEAAMNDVRAFLEDLAARGMVRVEDAR